MDLKTEKTLKEAYVKLLRVGFGDGAIEEMPQFIAEDVMGYGTAQDEKVMSIEGFVELINNQRKQAKQFDDFRYTSNPVILRLADNKRSALVVDEIELVTVIQGKSNTLPLRMSTVMELMDGAWKVTHWHGSLAEHVSEGEDPWHVNEWKQKTEKLERMVEEKTLDLEQKNRELEIESTLERVRTMAMGMRKPDDLLDVCKAISEQLELLQVSDIRNVQVAIIDESKKHYLNYQYFAPYSEEVFEVTEYENHPASKAMVTEMQKSVNSFFTGSMKGKALDGFREWRKKYDQFPDPLLDKSPAIYYYFYSIGTGGLGLTTYRKISEKSLEIFKRFHKVFTLAYSRFQDIGKAEAQAREAQIEAALERVRSRSMGMQKSEELADLSFELVKQVDALGIKTWFCAFNIYDDHPDGSLEWGSNLQGTYEAYRTPREGIFLRYYEAGQKGETLLVNEIGEKECPAHYDYLCSLPGVGEQLLAMKEAGISFPASQIDHVAFFKYGYIIFISFEPVPEAHDTFKRFAKVFEQTYTRFLDLKKAEAQAREAQIEAALERVRAHSIGMRNSDDFGIVTTEMFNQLRGFGEDLFAAGIVFCDKHEGHVEQWHSIPGGGMLSPFIVPVDLDYIHQYRYDQWKAGKEIFSVEIPGHFIEQHFQDIFDLPSAQIALKDLESRNAPMPETPKWEIDYGASFKHGYILISSLKYLESTDILPRFARVFEQAYTRFLDLRKAEEQAREAQVELSLERIRAQVTAMKESAELLDIVVMMRSEFVALGHEAHYFWYMRYLPGTYEKAMTSGDGARIGMVMTLPRHIHGDIKLLADWEKSDDPTVVFAMDVETAVDYVHKMITLGDFKQVDPNAPTLDDIRHIGGLTFVMARTTYGEIGFSLPGTVPDPPKEDLDTLVRFAAVFDLAYRRFEDLKDAEHRNREAQIELALERVRSRTMGMQKSEELAEVVAGLFSQLDELGIKTYRCSLGIVDPDNVQAQLWSTTNEGKVIPIAANVPLLENVHLKKMYNGWKKQGAPVIDRITGEKRLAWTDYINQFVDFKEYKPENIDRERIRQEPAILQNFFFRQGIFTIHTLEDLEEESFGIIQRFANVFEQTYTRFMDLQRAEAQGREAVKQASLDRIRGHIASMRNADDLKQITPLIWNELMTLEVPFFRCGVFIVDEKKKHVQVYLTTPEGKPLGALDLAFDANDLTRKTVESWRGGQVYQEHWSREQFVEWTKEMMKLRQIKAPENYQGAAAPPESLHLHFIPFAQGMLYVGHSRQLDEDRITLVKALAEAFSFAYARYEDFMVLEEAKRKVEKALGDLKATQAQLIHAEKMASLGELTAGIAHEIQNPLNFVNNFSDVSVDLLEELQEETDAGNAEEMKAILQDLKQNLEKIHHHGKRASDIVKGMLEHSRAGSGRKEPTDINALADEYLRLAYHGLRAKDKSFNAEFKLEASEDLPKVRVVGQDVGRVLLNLINNAFYAVSDRSKNEKEGFKPRVDLKTRTSDGSIEITVKDNGNGIPDKVREKIFQPFFTTKPTGEGTGLGLSLSYDIITKGHGGDLTLKTKVGQGTEFIITLPIN